MRQVLMRLADGAVIENVVDGRAHGASHRYAARRDGVTIAEFKRIDEVAHQVRDRWRRATGIPARRSAIK